MSLCPRPEVSVRRLLILVVVSCGSSPGRDAAPGTCDEEQAALVTELRIVRPVGDVSDGFDLDGVVTEAGGPSGCGVQDLTAPDGTAGVDNAFARLLPVLEATEAAVLETLVQDAIDGGQLLLMFRWAGLDEGLDDDCVTFEVFNGAGEAAQGADGRLLPGQTFDVDVRGRGDVVRGVSYRDGVIEAGPLSVTLPVQILRADLDLEVRDARVRLEPDGAGGWTGLVAGGIAVADILAVAKIEQVDPVVASLIEPLLTPLADLEPDADGTCTRISVVLEVRAVSAWVFADPA